jgi:hypothetical protein
MSTKGCNGETCFFCQKPIEGKGIEWQQQNNWRDNPYGEGLISIYLHGKCSVQLGLRLVRDGIKLVNDPNTKEWLQHQIEYEAEKYS